jgi:hypothetical protein
MRITLKACGAHAVMVLYMLVPSDFSPIFPAIFSWAE